MFVLTLLLVVVIGEYCEINSSRSRQYDGSKFGRLGRE
jgi:hypothetical protein